VPERTTHGCSNSPTRNKLASRRAIECGNLHELGVDDTAIYDSDLAIEKLVGDTLRHGYESGARASIRGGVTIAPSFVRRRATFVLGDRA